LGTADYKPVTQQSLEGLMKRVISGQYLVLPPLRIGLVFLGEVRTGHRQCRRRVFGAIDLPRVWQYGRKRLSQTRELFTVERKLTRDLSDRGVRVDEPTVAKPCRSAHRAVIIGGEPDRRMGLLDRPAGHRDIGQLTDVVLKADTVLGPQPLDDFQTLLETAD